MDFFMHDTKARRSKKLLKLQKDFGLGGIGFYWVAVEWILSEGCKIPLSFLKTVRDRPIREDQVEHIIKDYGLFDVDEDDMISLNLDVENAVGEEAIKILHSHICMGIRTTVCASAGANTGASAGAVMGASAGADARTSTGADVSADVSANDGASARSSGREKDKDKEKDKRNKLERAQNKFYEFMEQRCPHLMEMAEPLTFDEFRELKKSYSWPEIREVLLAMENDIGLCDRRRNCQTTALSWLKNRYGPPHGGYNNKKAGNAVFCGLDENGSPIFKQQNNNNGQQDSNTNDGSADAEQQGDGSGCAERPDERT